MQSEIIRVDAVDRLGWGEFEVHLLHEFGERTERFTPDKVKELWAEASKHSVLFSDITAGDIFQFISVILNPSSVWMEILREREVVGVAYVSRVIPKFDAYGHFAFWDGIANGRQVVIWEIMRWLFSRYELHRISAGVPPYQKGVIRFLRSLGFQQEGTRREAVLRGGKWLPLLEFGMMESELNYMLAHAEKSDE